MAILSHSCEARRPTAGRAFSARRTIRPWLAFACLGVALVSTDRDGRLHAQPEFPSPALETISEFPTQETSPAQAMPVQEMAFPTGNESPGQASFPLGESFVLRVPAAASPAGQVIVSREDFLLVTGVDGDGILREPSELVKFRGLKLGTTEVTFVGPSGSATISVRITPSIDHLEAVLARHFPEANLRLEFGGDQLLIVEGEVGSPAEIDPILNLLKRFIGDNNVINAIRVAGVMQVQLEVIFARVDRTELRKLGFNFLSSDAPWYAGSQIGGLINPPPIRVTPGIPNQFPVVGSVPVAEATTGALTGGASLFFGITREAATVFGYIDALKQQGAIKVLATPTLVTLSGRPAEFLAGGQQPVPVATGGGGNAVPSTAFKDFGTRLSFLPVVLGGNTIRLELVPSVSTVNFAAGTVIGNVNVPQFVTQKLHATVEMEAGQTLILGGLIETQKDSEVAKVPILGEMPVVGPLFRRVRDLNRETELLVMVTPRLVQPLSNKPTQYPGSESRNPTDWELFMQGSLEKPAGTGKCRIELEPPSIDAFPPSPLPTNARPVDGLPASGTGPMMMPPVSPEAQDARLPRLPPATSAANSRSNHDPARPPVVMTRSIPPAANQPYTPPQSPPSAPGIFRLRSR